MSTHQRAIPRTIVGVLATMIGLNAFSIDAYLPALPTIAAEFGASLQLVESSIGSYLVGYALGMLLAAPVSDRIGRRPVIYAGMCIYLAGTLAILLSGSASELLAFRLLQAFGAGVALVNVSAIVRDLFDEHDSARVLATISVIMLIIPLLAPLLGMLLLKSSGWRSIFAVLAGHAVLILLLAHRYLRETLAPRAVAADANSRSVVATISTNLGVVLQHRRAVAFALTAGIANSCLFLYLSDAAFVYMDYYGISAEVFPVLFGANVLGMAAMHRLNLYLLRRHPPRWILPRGIAVLCAGATCLLVYASLPQPQLLGVLCFIMLTIGALSLINNNCLAAYMSRFPDNAGMASAISGALVFSLGGLASWMLGALHDGTPRSLALAMAACAAAALFSSRVALAGEPAA